MGRADYPHTPDGKYFVSKGRLWRCTDPRLSDSDRRAAVKALMQARRAIHLHRDDRDAVAVARKAVDAAKHRLGERGPVWWADGADDVAGKHPKNTDYAAWWHELDEGDQRTGEG